MQTFHSSSVRQYNENDASFKIRQNMKRGGEPSLMTYNLKKIF